MAFIYTGGGYGGSLPNIPARDLTDEEAKQFGKAFLLATGLYVEATSRISAKKIEKIEVTDERH